MANAPAKTNSRSRKSEPFPEPDPVTGKTLIPVDDIRTIIDRLGGETSADAKDIALDFFAANTFDELFAAPELTSTADMEGRPFYITDAKVNDSTIEGDGPDVYMIIKYATPEGETGMFSSGALNVMTQITRMASIADMTGAKVAEVGPLTVLANVAKSGRNVYRLALYEA
jgi:hypothetical protein